MKLIAACAHSTRANGQNDQEKFLELPNHVDPGELPLHGIERIDLQFPKFTDGRAFSQAYLLRRRLGFQGELRATGDVLIDQLLQMKRSGFDCAVLRSDQDLSFAQAQLSRYPSFYQGDALAVRPRFAPSPSPEVLS